jgi:hypothetical protein
LKSSVGVSFHFLGAVHPGWLTTDMKTSSRSSKAATGTPDLITADAVDAASRIVGKLTTATLKSFDVTANFNVISVTKPSVPSERTNKPFSLYPAADLRDQFFVLIIVPSARTTVRLKTQSFIVPYRTALVPLLFVPTMPGPLVQDQR